MSSNESYNRLKPLSEAELSRLGSNFGEFSDESGNETEDEDEFVPDEAVSESEDELEEVIEEVSDAEGELDESIDVNIVGDEFTSKSGLKWFSKPKPTSRRKQRNIVTAKPGTTNYVRNAVTMKDVFDLLITDKMKEKVCIHTNEEAERDIANWNENNPNSKRKWKELDKIELDCFLGVLLKAGALRCRKESVHEIWTTEKSIKRSFFVAALSRDRFCQISRYIRFDDKISRAQRKSIDKLAAIRDIWEDFVSNCRNCFEPFETVTVDEQLVGFRGRCPFRQFIKSKPARYGIKIWALADVYTSYLYNLQVYTGKQPGGLPEKNQGSRVVKDLAKPLFGSGRGLTTDNFFTSFHLANDLLEKNLTLLGTVRKSNRDTPNELKIRGQSEKSSRFAFTGEISMVSYVPKKGRLVHVLSTQHSDTSISQEEHKKPIMILDYNSTKGGVDNADKLIREYTCARRTARWPYRLFMNILDICALNAFALFILKNPDWNKQKSFRRRIFLKDLSDQLAYSHMSRRSQQSELKQHIKDALKDCGFMIPVKPQTNKQGNKRGRCYACPRNLDKKSRIRCYKCKRFVCEEHRRDRKEVFCVSDCSNLEKM